MLLNFKKNLPEKYYRFWIWLLNLNNKIRILPVNFKKNWTKLFWQQKSLVFTAFTSEIIIQIFYTLTPQILGWIIEQKKFIYLIGLSIFWFFAILIEFLSGYFSSLLEVQTVNSIQYNSFLFFLTVDPIFHVKRESGKLFAKIERGARAYEDFLDIILWDLSPTIISSITVIVSFLYMERKLGIIAFFLLIFIAIINIGLNLLYTKSFERKLIIADDKVKTLTVESLTQIQLIRSYFASNEIAAKTKNSNEQLMFKEGTARIAFGAINFMTRFVYLLSFATLGYFVINLITSGKITLTLGITLLLTYLNGTYEIITIGRRVNKLLRAITRVKDLFSFVREFGIQTFPVSATNHLIEEKVKIARSMNIINLQAIDLHFDYNPKAKIFEEHNLSITISREQPNKLYGIIGPSGMGKTTLLSILGGQLKPSTGKITLNDISIYDLDDNGRKKLIAVQGQIASTLSGTIKQNLLLGLPSQEIFSNDELIAVLKKVGIWKIFEEKDGLDTMLGESGLNLSGGQRQRLNFASLYIRAKYYRPLLILIDEPTSSLDEVSEKAITTMISKLAEHALTLVIAHRLKTLDDAVGIIDFSLIYGEKIIQVHSREELKEKSVYFKRLLEGQINIEI